MTDSTASLLARAQRVLVGGVNSPVRAFKSVGGDPAFIVSGRGSRMTDLEGRELIDLVGSWGPLILGHADPEVIETLIETAKRGTSFGATSPVEIEMAEMVCELVPSIERVRMVNSGTEATMSAVRAARGFTGRELVIKFEGSYHGHGEAFLIKAGSGATTLGVPDSAGVPEAVAASTLVARFNDLDSVRALFESHSGAVAALIVEPVAGNMGTIAPQPGFLEGLRSLCDTHGAMLIFDEVMTGFRVALGGAQALYGVKPDLTTLGKIIGGGLPVGAYGGRADVMAVVSPSGPVYQGGTLSGNPLAMAVGLITLRRLRKPGVYEQLEKTSWALAEGLRSAAKSAGVPATLNRVGSMLTLFFTDQTVVDFTTAKSTDTERFGRYFQEMFQRGVYLPPSQFEAMFVSLAHTDADIDAVIAAARESLASLA
jgi:glutamate-1-semialdehyde 2,1-aminomutase